MSFLNPIFLYAFALVGIPVLIHLIRRRKLKIIQWAAMDFLRQSQKKQKRRLRIEELILLALRMLIVALAVMAFTRPVLRALGIPLLSQNTPVYAILVLDNSFGMDAKGRDGKTAFARAQATANEILGTVLKSGDSASLILLSDKPQALVQAPSFDLTLLRQRIQGLKVSDRATDYLEGARLVTKLLKASKTPVKEVYWLSDDQAAAWKSGNTDAARAVWSELGKLARVTWVSVGAGEKERDNLAIETPTLARELVTPQLQARIEAKVANYSPKQRNTLVNLIVDGKKQGSANVALSPGMVTNVKFPYRFVQPGPHTGRIEFADAATADVLEKDNSAPFAVRCRERINILVQDVRPSRDPAKSESFYLLTAMAPGGEAESLAPKLRDGEGFGNTVLRDYDTVVIAGATGLSPADKRVLTEYVKAGGGLFLFPGPNTDAARLNTDFAELLPGKLGTRRLLAEEEAISLNPATIAHSALNLFKDTTLLNIGTARFTTYFPLEPAADSDPNSVQIMLRFSNGDPAFIERRVGLGKVILAASSAGANWNQLPLKASYVPLMYQILSYLGQGPTSRHNVAQDEPFFLALPLTDANKPVRVTGPDNKTVTQNSSLDTRGVTFSYPSTGQAGIYRVEVAGGKTKDAFAVGLPAAESDLTFAAPNDALKRAGLPAQSLTVADSPARLTALVRSARYGSEIWRPLLWAIIPLLFLESLLAQLFGRRG